MSSTKKAKRILLNSPKRGHSQRTSVLSRCQDCALANPLVLDNMVLFYTILFFDSAGIIMKPSNVLESSRYDTRILLLLLALILWLPVTMLCVVHSSFKLSPFSKAPFPNLTLRNQISVLNLTEYN